MRTYRLIGFFLCFTGFIYAGNVGAGTAPVSKELSQYNSQWAYHTRPKAPQKSYRPPSDTVFTSHEYIDQNGERWTVFQKSDGSYWEVNSQKQLRRFNQP